MEGNGHLEERGAQKEAISEGVGGGLSSLFFRGLRVRLMSKLALAPRELAGRLIPSQPSNQLIILCTVAPSLQKEIGEWLLPLKNNNVCFETTINSIITDTQP